MTEPANDTPKVTPRKGVKRPHRSQLQREHDRARVAELLLQKGMSARRIAKEFGLSASSVRRDIKALRAEWKRERLQDHDSWVARQLAELSMTQRAAWDGWQRSLLPTSKRSTRSKGVTRKPDQQHGGKVQIRADDVLQFEQMAREESTSGDPRFLEIVERCITSRSKLLGLLAPIKIAPTSPGGDEPYVDVRERLLAVLEQQAAHQARELPPGIIGAGEQPRLPAADVTLAEQPDGSYDATGESGPVEPEFSGLVIRR
jgi:hypothetical protein